MKLDKGARGGFGKQMSMMVVFWGVATVQGVVVQRGQMSYVRRRTVPIPPSPETAICNTLVRRLCTTATSPLALLLSNGIGSLAIA